MTAETELAGRTVLVFGAAGALGAGVSAAFVSIVQIHELFGVVESHRLIEGPGRFLSTSRHREHTDCAEC